MISTLVSKKYSVKRYLHRHTLSRMFELRTGSWRFFYSNQFIVSLAFDFSNSHLEFLQTKSCHSHEPSIWEIFISEWSICLGSYYRSSLLHLRPNSALITVTGRKNQKLISQQWKMRRWMSKIIEKSNQCIEKRTKRHKPSGEGNHKMIKAMDFEQKIFFRSINFQESPSYLNTPQYW